MLLHPRLLAHVFVAAGARMVSVEIGPLAIFFSGLLIGYVRILRSVTDAASVRARHWVSLLIDRTIHPHQASTRPDALAKFVARL
jgi:hypothetical protein